jgi:hypothetical protein
MTLFIFVGDMLVMAFMVGVAIWFGTSGTSEAALAAARIPLEDEDFGSTEAAGKSSTRGNERGVQHGG